MSKFYITTPIYYVNAKPHIGSAYTTIAADVLARWHRQTGDDVHFLTGTAEHGTKMAEAAKAAGKTPQEFVDENSGYFKEAWKKLNISNDDFIRTTEARHEKAVATFFERLKDSEKIYEADYEGLYCVGHEAFIKESELDDQGNCPDHKTAPEKIKEKNWFFKLSEYGDLLTKKIESGELEIAPENIKKEVLSFIKQGLDDISISRPNVEWALPLPWDKEQSIYVWLDELWNYQTAADGNWPADLHLVGKDIIKFHCIIWPALLEAIGEEWPKKVFAHGFFTVDGQKMSKSLGNIVDPVEVAEEYSVDALRYFILRDIPFGNDGDFSHERLKERYNADLANGLGNLVSRTLNMIDQYNIDVIPAPAVPSRSPEGRSGEPESSALATEISDSINQLAFDKALATIWEEIAKADQLIEEKKPWELAKAGKDDEVKEVLQQLFNTLIQVNIALAPFIPETHEKLTQLLEARPLKKPSEPLFARKD